MLANDHVEEDGRRGRIEPGGAAGRLRGSDDDDTPASPAPNPAPVASRPMELTILHINDHHSNLDSRKKT